MDTSLPILYSLRNCPYAMRARIAVFKSRFPVELRDIVLSNKPKQMTDASPKATVPVLVLANNTIIDESLDVMLWVLKQRDPDNLLHINETETGSENALKQMLMVIERFDTEFKSALEAYKCAKRYHESNLITCRQQCEVFIKELEERLSSHEFLFSNHESLLDIAVLPYIRQFARIERQWYLKSPYPNVRQWLNRYLQSLMFSKVMTKYPLWQDGQAPTLMTL